MPNKIHCYFLPLFNTIFEGVIVKNCSLNKSFMPVDFLKLLTHKTERKIEVRSVDNECRDFSVAPVDVK